MEFIKNRSFKKQIRRVFEHTNCQGGLYAMGKLGSESEKLYYCGLRTKNVHPSMVATIILTRHLRVETAMAQGIDLGNKNTVIMAASYLGLDVEDMEKHGILDEGQFFMELCDLPHSIVSELAKVAA